MDIAVLKAYVRVVEEGSFSAAARELGMSKSMCSKNVSDLEASLGVRLLSRSTRSVKPTQLGQEYYARIKTVLAELDAATEAIRTHSDRPMGRLKIGSPVTYTLKVLRPCILRFMEAYPEIELEAVLDDRCSDIVAEGYDAVIRVGELDDSSLVARRLFGSRTHVVASPGYLDHYGRLAEPADLSRHRCLLYTHMRGSGTWPLQRGNDLIHQKINVTFRSNNGEMIREAALGGHGIALLPEFMVEGDLAEGSLVPILTEYSPPDLPISLVYPTRRNVTAALKAFLDFTADLSFRCG